MKNQSFIFKSVLKKLSRVSLSIILAMSMVISGFSVTETQAAKAICETYSGSNLEKQNYSRWSSTMKSYLTPLGDGTFMRVQYGAKIEGLLVEYYDKDYNITSSKIVSEELPVFGGFCATENNYFLVTGQTNTEESNTKEVYRITKYDKNWKKIKSAGLSSCNTTVPFDAGSCRMDMCGKYLLIRTCHEMYTSSDGYNHQANVTIEVDTDAMTITDSYTSVMNSSIGYVSHSFNQFIKVENNKIVAVDHGDAYPRAIALLNYQTDVSTGKFVPGYNSQCEVTNVLAFPGAVGDNTTGASIGGFEISNSKYLIAGNSVVQDSNNTKRSTRNVFVAAVGKSDSQVNINWLTDYEEGDGTTSTPQMVKITNDKYIILWSRDKKVYYTTVNGSGTKSGSVYSMDGNLSDCVPIVSNGKLVWYTWNENIITFYDINLNNLSDSNKTEIVNGHHYENTGVTDGVATLKCSVCQKEEEMKVATSMKVWWNDTGSGYYYSYFTSPRKIGEKLYCWIQPSPTDANTEMEIISSDSSVASVEMTNNTNGIITPKDVGTVQITVRPKYNPDYSNTYKVTVTGPLKLKSFTVDKSSSLKYGDTVNLMAEAAGGNGTLQYKFYEKLSNGTTKVIRDYSSSAIYQWKPDVAGTRTIYVDVKDGDGTVLTSSISDFVVKKADAPTYNDIAKSYCYAVGSDSQSMDIASLLPKDRGTCSYKVSVSDKNSILKNVSVSDAGILNFDVKNTGNIGDTATITVSVSSDNYETMSIKVQILLTDKKKVAPKAGSEPKISGGNQLTYGQKLSALSLGKEAVFVADSGEKVVGTLSFENPEVVPTVETTTAKWIFVPDSKEYSSCIGSVDIVVNKATPTISGVTSEKTTYVPNMTLSDITLNAGTATATVVGVDEQISGTWSWKTLSQSVQTGSKKYIAVFTPKDLNNYNITETEVDVVISQASPIVEVLPDAGEITYGQSLENSSLVNGTAKVGTTVISGTFCWADKSIHPVVSDSQKTKYDVIFIPDDSVNYETAFCKVTLTVHPIENAPNMPENFMNVSNSVTKVRQIELPQGWSWQETDIDKDLIVGQEITAIAVYKDRDNYKVSSVAIDVFRSECEHIESEMIIDVEATCTETGEAHTKCTICGAILKTNIEIPVIVHNYGDWKCENEEIHRGTCQMCGSMVEESHSWNQGVVTKEPTVIEEGIRTFTCTLCKAEKTEKISPLPGHTVCPPPPYAQKNTVFTQNGMKYKVTKEGRTGEAEVILVSVDKNKKSVTVHATITINGVQCKVVSIAAKAFSNNKKITKVVIGKNVKTIGKKAFYKCKKLKKITVKSKVLKKVGKKAIKGINKKAVIKVSKKKLKAYKKLFGKKSGFVKTMKVKK